jgi:heme-degrading monooxygenase HmoA
MFARLTVVQGSPDRVDEGIRVAQEIAARAKEVPGFGGGYWAVDRSRGISIALTTWETEQALQHSQAFWQQVREGVARTMGGQVMSAETYEVVAQA